jgi:hypothetical protein
MKKRMIAWNAHFRTRFQYVSSVLLDTRLGFTTEFVDIWVLKVPAREDSKRRLRKEIWNGFRRLVGDEDENRIPLARLKLRRSEMSEKARCVLEINSIFSLARLLFGSYVNYAWPTQPITVLPRSPSDQLLFLIN